MIKKILFIFIISLLIASQYAYPQCTPGPYTLPGIYPDSATGFPPAYATLDYNLVVTAVVPVDTMIYPFPRLNIDSIGVVMIEGLPEGFTAIANRPSGYWLGGTAGCMKISGRPTRDQIGIHPLTFKLVGFMGRLGLPIPYDVTFYSITVYDSSGAGIYRPENDNHLALKALPNPFHDNLNLKITTQHSIELDALLYDSYGREMMRQTFQTQPGENTLVFNTHTLSNGVYLCRVINRARVGSMSIRVVKPF